MTDLVSVEAGEQLCCGGHCHEEEDDGGIDNVEYSHAVRDSQVLPGPAPPPPANLLTQHTHTHTHTETFTHVHKIIYISKHFK